MAINVVITRGFGSFGDVHKLPTRGFGGAPVVTPVADFSGTPLFGDIPLSVAFTDLSTNTPASWLWDFGDGQTSTQQNPVHVYAVAGTYTVSLTATNTGGGDTRTRTNYVAAAAVVSPDHGGEFWRGRRRGPTPQRAEVSATALLPLTVTAVVEVLEKPRLTVAATATTFTPPVVEVRGRAELHMMAEGRATTNRAEILRREREELAILLSVMDPW